MTHEYVNLQIILLLTFGFGLASVLGYLAYRLHLSPILGYLLAGYIIGPYSPGYVADNGIAEQLAEIGVILMMFGVGMHFKWQDLYRVKSIAIPGAFGQTIAAALFCLLIVLSIGWSFQTAIVYGMAVGVASTIVLVRGLSEHKLLHTSEGHICIGWLIIEDLFTIIFLLLLPILATPSGTQLGDIFVTSGLILLKCLALVTIIFTVGRKVSNFVLVHAVRSDSHELFTISILAIAFLIATGSALIFGTSIALGAFLAGMLIGQTDIRHQVTTNTTPMKDAFLVIFFIAVGMLFNPLVLTTHLGLFLATLGVILIVKPVTAFLITIIFKHPLKLACTVAVALSQIGEFSFILAEEANRLGILPDDGYDVIVASAIVSISLNPSAFKLLSKLQKAD